MSTELTRYPIGRFKAPESLTEESRVDLIEELERFPGDLRAVVTPLSGPQLDTPYRVGGWTIRQLVHHISDSHTSSYIRFKWTLTEDCPVIKAYDEKDWALLPDAREAPIDISLDAISTLHRKWVWLLKNLALDQWKRSFIHPETNATVPLDQNLALYAWHGKHHLKHITNCIHYCNW